MPKITIAFYYEVMGVEVFIIGTIVGLFGAGTLFLITVLQTSLYSIVF